MTNVVEDLTREDYQRIRKLVYAQSGIDLGDNKMQLVKARLGKHVRKGGFTSFRQYFRHVESDSSGRKLCGLLDAISTNTTHLFRESHHFDRLKQIVRGWMSDRAWRARHPAVRIWSAACSSGEEPYSIAMVAHDAIQDAPGVKLKILATDLSIQMLERAQRAVFEPHRVGTVPPPFRNRYLKKVQQDGKTLVQIVPELRDTIRFARFNLMSSAFPFRHGFDVTFCRNVMIYFDRPTQETLVGKMANHLHDGGYLFIGHSESLTGMRHPLSYVEPTIYRKG